MGVKFLSVLQHFLAARWRQEELHGEKLKNYQEARIRKIVRFTLQNSPFYREHWKGSDPRDWRNLPLIDKSLMMAHFSRLNTQGVTHGEALDAALHSERDGGKAPTLRGATAGLSSGTSGSRGLFLVDQREQAAWTGTLIARVLHRLESERVAFFLRANNTLYENIERSKFITLRYFDLSTPIESFFTALQGYNPTLLVAPPSVLALLAEAQLQGKINIRPRRLISVAEVLEPQDQLRLEVLFQAPVHQIYQATEGFLAASCAHGRLHIQEDVTVLQLQKAFQSSLSTSETRYTAIVTDLWRQTQPIIRYHLNDLLTLSSERCPCGSDWRILNSVEGRLDDTLYFESDFSTGWVPLFPGDFRRLLLASSRKINDYQVIQNVPGELWLYLHAPDHPTAGIEVERAIRHRLTSLMAQLGYRVESLQIEFGLPDRKPWIKRRRVERKWYF